MNVLVSLLLLTVFSHQVAPSPVGCVCDLISVEKTFPYSKLTDVEDSATKCQRDVTSQMSMQLSSLLLGLKWRMAQLEADVSELERENDGDLYGALSLRVIENEMAQILLMVHKLNVTSRGHHQLSTAAAQELQDQREVMTELEQLDTMQVVKREQANQRLKRDLDQCHNRPPPTPPPTSPNAFCPYGNFKNVTGPRIITQGEYPGSYKLGAWGRDPKAAPGKEKWYWMVILTASNIFAHYVRLYSSLSSLIVGVSVPGNMMISPSNPTTNTIQGPNAVLYGDALYYNCYNRYAVCRFNIQTKAVTSVELPKDTRYNSKGNYCYLDGCYSYTDIDLATDESGVWVIYTTAQSLGNLVLSRVTLGEQPQLGQAWTTSLYKAAVSNTFMACGVLYATRFVSKDVEEIFYSFDTTTGRERFDVGVHFNKVAPHIASINYSPVDKMLHVYNDAYMVSYDVEFDGSHMY